MADETTTEQPAGAEFVLTGSRFVYRDSDNVLVIKTTGDKVRLTPEQAQRLGAGKPGSPFQPETEVVLPESDEVAVANEATTPGSTGFKVSPDGTRNRKVPHTAVEDLPQTPDPDEEPAPRPAAGEIPEPITSTAVSRDTRQPVRKAAGK